MREHRWGTVLTGTATVVGLLVSSGVVAVLVAGALQWTSALSPFLDNLIPLLVLFAGMLLAGRVSVDVSGQRGPLAVVGAAAVVAAIGWALSRTSEAHGDGIEAQQVIGATLVVLLVTGLAAVVTARRRRRTSG
jgi:hypothetical protein